MVDYKLFSWIKNFYPHYGEYLYYCHSYSLDFFGDIFFKSFSDDTNFYIPSILNSSEEDIKESFDILQPVSYSRYSGNYSTVLTALFKTNYTGYLQKVKIKEEIYYLGKSVILDKNFNPIVLNVHQYTKEPFALVKVLTYIDNSIFNEDSLLNKFLIKKFIPALAELKNLDILHYTEVPIDIIITKIDNTFICKSIEPIEVNISQDINDLLSRHIDRVMDKL